MSLFRPPIVRSASAILDRSLFSKTILIAAARVANPKNISRFRTQLEKSKELAKLERIQHVQSDPDPALAKNGVKCLLLRPEIKPEGEEYTDRGRKRLNVADPATWSEVLREAVKQEELRVIPFDMKLDYNYWTYRKFEKTSQV